MLALLRDKKIHDLGRRQKTLTSEYIILRARYAGLNTTSRMYYTS